MRHGGMIGVQWDAVTHGGHGGFNTVNDRGPVGCMELRNKTRRSKIRLSIQNTVDRYACVQYMGHG